MFCDHHHHITDTDHLCECSPDEAGGMLAKWPLCQFFRSSVPNSLSAIAPSASPEWIMQSSKSYLAMVFVGVIFSENVCRWLFSCCFYSAIVGAIFSENVCSL